MQIKQEPYDDDDKFVQCSTVSEGKSFSDFYDWTDDNLDIKVENEDEYVCDSPKYGSREVQLINYGNDSVDIFEVEKISGWLTTRTALRDVRACFNSRSGYARKRPTVLEYHFFFLQFNFFFIATKRGIFWKVPEWCPIRGFGIKKF